MLEAIITAIIVVMAIGLICAVVLVIASVLMGVKENEQEVRIRSLLPGANCGACGYSGCDAYAKALVNKKGTKPNLCTPGGRKVSAMLSKELGVEHVATVEMVATVRCCGDCTTTDTKTLYYDEHWVDPYCHEVW